MTDAQAGAIRSVVRGERHWSELRSHGLDVGFWDEAWHFGVWPDGALSVEEADIAAGMRAHRSRSDDLIEWASFIMAASFVDLANLRDRKDEVLTCLQDIAFGDLDGVRGLLERSEGGGTV